MTIGGPKDCPAVLRLHQQYVALVGVIGFLYLLSFEFIEPVLRRHMNNLNNPSNRKTSVNYAKHNINTEDANESQTRYNRKAKGTM